MMQFVKSSKGNDILINVISFFVLLAIPSFADLESISPAGVDHKLEIISEDSSRFLMRSYGSQIVNCKRKNETYNAEVGFNVSDHSGKKYNTSTTFQGFEYKTDSMGSWGTFSADSTNIETLVREHIVSKSNLNNLKSNNDYLYLRGKFRKYNLSCVNQEMSENGITYWLHSYLMAGPDSLGGEPGDEYQDIFVVYIWDGENLKQPATIELIMDENPIGQEKKTKINITVKIFDEINSASYYNELPINQLYLNLTNIETNDENGVYEQNNLALNDFHDVVGGVDTYCMMTLEYTGEGLNLDQYFYKFSGVVWLSTGFGDIHSNEEFATIGYQGQIDTFYRIYYTVTSGGTVNCNLYNIQRGITGSRWYYNIVDDESIQWDYNGEQSVGKTFVFNPYKSNNGRDVPRLIYVTANYKNHEIGEYIRVPKLGESKELEIEVENSDKVPEDENLPIEEDNFNSDGTTNQTNELLNEILKEFKNSRDENYEFMKGVADFMDIDGGGINQSVQIGDVEKTETEIQGIEDGLKNKLGEGLGIGTTEDGVGDGFGNGLGHNVNQFKNLTEKDMSFTIDLRGCGEMFPSMNCESWIWTFSLYPDLSTVEGQGIDRIVKTYVRPLFLFFMWLVLGINCVKDISSYFGNNSNV